LKSSEKCGKTASEKSLEWHFQPRNGPSKERQLEALKIGIEVRLPSCEIADEFWLGLSSTSRSSQIFGLTEVGIGIWRLPTIARHTNPSCSCSVMDLIAQGRITENLIGLSYDLVDTFTAYWASIMPAGATASMAYPFPRKGWETLLML
jgi:hypothetical protein